MANEFVGVSNLCIWVKLVTFFFFVCIFTVQLPPGILWNTIDCHVIQGDMATEKYTTWRLGPSSSQFKPIKSNKLLVWLAAWNTPAESSFLVISERSEGRSPRNSLPFLPYNRHIWKNGFFRPSTKNLRVWNRLNNIKAIFRSRRTGVFGRGG